MGSPCPSGPLESSRPWLPSRTHDKPIPQYVVAQKAVPEPHVPHCCTTEPVEPVAFVSANLAGQGLVWDVLEGLV